MGRNAFHVKIVGISRAPGFSEPQRSPNKSASWLFQKERRFGANFEGPTLHMCYSTWFLHLCSVDAIAISEI